MHSAVGFVLHSFFLLTTMVPNAQLQWATGEVVVQKRTRIGQFIVADRHIVSLLVSDMEPAVPLHYAP